MRFKQFISEAVSLTGAQFWKVATSLSARYPDQSIELHGHKYVVRSRKSFGYNPFYKFKVSVVSYYFEDETADQEALEGPWLQVYFSLSKKEPLIFSRFGSETDVDDDQYIIDVADYDLFARESFYHDLSLWMENLDSKEAVVKQLLTTYRSGVDPHVIKSLIIALRNDGKDYPEFATIEKSVDGAIAAARAK